MCLMFLGQGRLGPSSSGTAVALHPVTPAGTAPVPSGSPNALGVIGGQCGASQNNDSEYVENVRFEFFD